MRTSVSNLLTGSELVNELNTVILPPLELERYLRLPEVIDGHRVLKHDRFVRREGAGVDFYRLKASAVRHVIEECRKAGRVSLSSLLPGVPEGFKDQEVFVYNPRNLPVPTLDELMAYASGDDPDAKEVFTTTSLIAIDGDSYYLDAAAFGKDDFERIEDRDLAEFFAQSESD